MPEFRSLSVCAVGSYVCENGDSCDGQYTAGRMEGFGCDVWTQGRRKQYEREYRHADGRIERGRRVNDLYISEPAR